MKGVLLLVILMLPLFAEEANREWLKPSEIRSNLKLAERLFKSEDPEDNLASARIFNDIAENSREGEIDLDAVRLAEAMARLKAVDISGSLKAQNEIRGFDHPLVRARRNHHRGNAHLAAGEQAFAQKEFDAAREHMESAVQSFIESLQDDPASDDTRRNLEIANRRLQHVIDNTPPPPPGDPEAGDEDQDDDSDEQEESPEPQPQPGDDSDPSDPDQTDPSDPSDPSEDSDPDGSDESDTDPAPADPDEATAAPEDSDDSPETAEDSLDPDDFSEEDAQRTLDALLEQERRLRDEILRDRARNLRTPPVEKDW